MKSAFSKSESGSQGSSPWWEAMVEGLILVDQKRRILRVNGNLASKLGYLQEDLEDLSWEDIEPAQGEVKFRLWWSRLVSGESTIRETTLRKADGGQVPVKIQARKMPDSPEMAIFHITFLDFSTRLFQLFELSARVSRTAAWDWDLVMGSFTITPEIYRILDMDPPEDGQAEENIVQLLKARLSLDQVRELTRAVKSIHEERQGYETVFGLNWDGQSRNLRFVAEPILEDGKVKGLRGCIQEITHPDDDGATGGDSLARLVLDRSDALMAWVEPDCSLRYVNDSLVEQLGFSRKELLGSMEILDIDVENTQSQWEKYWNELSSCRVMHLESSFLRKDGTVFPVEMHLTYLDIGELPLISISARDITRRRQEEARLKTALIEVNSLSRQLEAENIYMKEELSSSYNLKNIITRSPAYRKVLEQVEQVAPTAATVLITGETGTGKELLARAIHSLSRRKDRPLVKVDCATLPKELIESELFGHEKGAFTGASQTRIGRFEVADGGSIFLDEIGELPLKLQSKLLRVLQEGEFERLGSTKTRTTDVRIIAATNRDLEKMVEQNQFRSDLFYRLNVFPIHSLPLRRRREDIPLLVTHFMSRFSEKNGKEIKQVPEKVMDRLKAYDYPGNVRELENIMERAVILSHRNTLSLAHWQPKTVNDDAGKEMDFPAFEEMQREYIVRVLQHTRWKVSGPGGAAELLDLNPQTLYSKMRKLGISRESGEMD